MSISQAPIKPAGIVRYGIILGGLAAIGPLTIDMYLPALPRMSGDLRATSGMLQLALAAYLAGLAVGIFVLGPVSDAVGRRRPLLAGLVLYVASSVMCAFSVSALMFIGGRTLQGLGAAAGIVIVRAAARDMFSDKAVARIFSVLMLVNGAGPVVAPLIGSQLVAITSWRGVFVVLGAVGVAQLVVVAMALPETLPHVRRTSVRLGSTLRRYRTLLGDWEFVAYALIFSIVFGGLFAYVSASSFVLQAVYALSPQQFGAVYAVNGAAIAVAGGVNAYLVGRVRERTLLVAGVVASAVGAVGVLLAGALTLGLVALLVPLLIAVGSIGVVAPNATALALAEKQKFVGTATALLCVMQLVAAGLGVLAGGGGDNPTPVSMGVAMTMFAVIGMVGLLALPTKAPASDLAQ